MPVDTEQAHRQAIIDTFSRDSEYWRNVYEETPEKEKVGGLMQGGVFANSEIVDRRNVVLDFVDKYAGHRKVLVLDLGCGTGMTMRDILKRGHGVVGTDITEAMLHQAKTVLERYIPGRANCILGDGENVPFKDRSFDVVLCMGVLQYLRTDQRIIAEMSRVVRDGGIVVLTLPNILRINNVLDPYYYIVKGIEYIAQKNPLSKNCRTGALSSLDFIANTRFAHRRYYYGQLSALFKRNNLRRLAVRGIGFGPMTFWRKQLLPIRFSIRISRFMQNAALKKHFSLLNIFANRWVVCLIKS